MSFWIVTDGNEPVGKFDSPTKPDVPDQYAIEEVDLETLQQTDVNQWFDE